MWAAYEPRSNLVIEYLSTCKYKVIQLETILQTLLSILGSVSREDSCDSGKDMDIYAGWSVKYGCFKFKLGLYTLGCINK